MKDSTRVKLFYYTLMYSVLFALYFIVYCVFFKLIADYSYSFILGASLMSTGLTSIISRKELYKGFQEVIGEK